MLSGLALGSIYALLALAMVLVHKATDVINFAQGEMAMFTTFVAWVLLSRFGLPLPLVFLLGVPIGLLFGAAIQRVFIRPLAGAPPVNVLIVTIGLWVVINSLAGWIWGYDPYTFPSLLPAEPLEFFGMRTSMNSLAIIAVTLLTLVVLYVFFEYTREGTAMRAVSMNPWAARLMGIRVEAVATLSWAVAGAIGAIAGMLVAPVTFLDFEMMVSLLVKAFAGALLGGFNSLPGAVAGGVLIGVLESLFGAYVSTAFKDSFAFLLILCVLMFKPTGLFGISGPKKV